MSSGQPLVSVVIPSYNRPNRIGSATKAVLEQTYENQEIIIVDDCSDIPVTEALTEEILCNDKVNIIRHETNQGASAARNTGIERSNGDFITFLDDDDTWYEEKLENQVDTFQSTSDDVGVVYSYIEHTGSNGLTIWIDDEECGDDVTETLLYGNCVGTFSTVMVRSDIIDLAGLLDEQLPSWQDREWYFRLSMYCQFKSTGTVDVKHRHSEGERISGNLSKLVESTLPQFLDSIFSHYSPGRIERRRIIAQNYTNVARYAIANDDYGTARRLLLKSLLTFPITNGMLGYAFVAISGKTGYRLARELRKQVSKAKQTIRGETR
jgi:glycosyltransferase involved in cell wall biosynthesis